MARSSARQLHDHAKPSECPDKPKYRQTSDIAQRTERKWGVRSGDQQKNRRVIKNLEKTFSARLRQGVVERRPEIQQQHRYRKNDRADKKPGAATLQRGQQQNRRTD